MAQFSGKVIWFNSAKGYGFLSTEGVSDVFCHYSAIVRDGYKTLKEGQSVEFDVVQDDHGRQAANVMRLK
jgi:cold shock protein